jgi:hypothetical protein
MRLGQAAKVLILLAVALSCVLPMTSNVAADGYVFYSQSPDGTIYSWSGDYAAAQGLHNIIGTDNVGVEYTTTQITIGQDNNTSILSVFRGVVMFNTAALPDGATITAATLSLWVSDNQADTAFDVYVVEGGDVHNPLVKDDFDVLYSKTITQTAALDTNTMSLTAYNDLALTAGGLNLIVLDGYTVFGLRSNLDISATSPVGDEYIKIWSGESIHPPKLSVTYTAPVMGQPDSLTLDTIMVFTDYRQPNDQLFVFRTTVVHSYTPVDAIPEDYYCVNFYDVDNTTILGQVPLRRWGYSPLSIYFDNVTAVDWGLAYHLKLESREGMLGTDVEYDYLMSSTSGWRGMDMYALDNWVWKTVDWLESVESRDDGYYSTAYGGQNYVNEAGTAVFTEGIPWIDVVRPNLFLVPGFEPIDPGDDGDSYATGLYDHWGAYFGGAFTDIGSSFGIAGTWIAGLFMMVLAGGAVFWVRQQTNESPLAMLAALPVFALAVLFGAVPMAVALIGALVCLFLLGYNLWLRNT